MVQHKYSPDGEVPSQVLRDSSGDKVCESGTYIRRHQAPVSGWSFSIAIKEPTGTICPRAT